MQSRSAVAGHAALLERLSDALHAGVVEPEQVERLLTDRRAGWRVPVLLLVVGVLTAYAGAALALGVAYPDLPRLARIALPFAFPAASLAAAIAVHRRRGPAWVVEVAAMTGYVALAAAQVVAAVEIDAGAGYATVGGLLSAGLVAAVTRLTRALRAAGWGLSSSLVVAATAAAIWADASAAEAPWLYVLQAGVALLVGAGLLRAGREGVEAALRTAALLVYAAAAVGVSADDWHASPWHGVLSVAIVATFVAAARLDRPALAWVGAAGAVAVWLPLVAVAAGDTVGVAAAVVGGGAALAALGALARRRRALAGG